MSSSNGNNGGGNEVEKLFAQIQEMLNRSSPLGELRGGRPFHYILRDHEPVPVDDFMLWGMWYQDADRIVKQEQIGDYWVSTVFLGLDHNWNMGGPPVLFETMVFIEGSADAHERYCTWDEAMAGHEAICERLRESG